MTGRPPSLIPPAAALEVLLDGRPEPPLRRLAVQEAAGHVLAEPVLSPRDLPVRAVALRDGWALPASATIGASAYDPAWLAQAPARIRAGELLPEGADAVLPEDAVIAGPGPAQALLATVPGEGVRRAGEDAAAGQVLCAAGRRLRALEAALAAAAGIDSCTVRVPTLALVTSPGAEAVAAILAAAARGAGAAIRAARPDEAAALLPDLVVAVGAELPGPVTRLAAGLAIRPGELTRPARIGEVPALLVPPRPEAALAAALLLLVPLLDRLSGRTERPPALMGRLTRKITSTIGVSDLALLRRAGPDWEPLVAGELTLAAMAAAGAWIAVPPEREGWAAGTPIEVHALTL